MVARGDMSHHNAPRERTGQSDVKGIERKERERGRPTNLHDALYILAVTRPQVEVLYEVIMFY